jgi:hypothetical protein
MVGFLGVILVTALFSAVFGLFFLATVTIALVTAILKD